MKFSFPYQMLSFSQRLFYSVVVLFLAFVVCFMAFQYRREKDYKVELMNTQLQYYNDKFSEYILQQDTLDTHLLEQYVKNHHLNDLRVTLINSQGKVVYDNLSKNTGQFRNHLNRTEIKQALQQGSGYAIHRMSEGVGGEFFYSARYYPELGMIIRSALPYNVSLTQSLSTDSHYIWFAGIISLVLICMFYRLTRKLSMSVTNLH